MFNFPYTNFHRLNLDWIVAVIAPWRNVTATANSVEYGAPPSVNLEKSESETIFNFNIPEGRPGYGTVTSVNNIAPVDGNITVPLSNLTGVANILDYGAAGDGVTDDSAALLSALADHNAVFLPPGRTFIVNTTISKNNFSIFGAGQESRLNGSLTINNSSHVSLYNLSMDGNTNLLTLTNSSYVIINNVHMGFWQDNSACLKIRGTAQAIYCNNCTFSNSTICCLDISNMSGEVVNDIGFNNCWFAYNRDNGEAIAQKSININANGIIQAMSFSNCDMSNGRHAFYTSGSGLIRYLKFANCFLDGRTVWNALVKDAEFANCWFSGQTGIDCHQFMGAKNVRIANSLFCPAGSAETAALLISNLSEVSISNSTIAGAAETGIAITSAAKVRLSGCDFSKSAELGNAGNIATAIYIDGSFSGKLFLESNDLSEIASKVVGAGTGSTLKYINNIGVNNT
jgi:hypothetical protein